VIGPTTVLVARDGQLVISALQETRITINAMLATTKLIINKISVLVNDSVIAIPWDICMIHFT
jgi:hypothetical protein